MNEKKDILKHLTIHQKALSILEKHSLTDRSDLVTSYIVIYQHLGHHDFALECYQHALEISKKMPPFLLH